MIKRVYSEKLKKKVWAYDVRIGGQRKRDSGFEKREDAEAAVVKLRQEMKKKRYGLAPEPPPSAPAFSELIERRLSSIALKPERVRSKRVLEDFASLLPARIKVSEITTADVRLYVEKRQKENLVPQSINRELNIIAATLNSAASFYPQLEQWVPPKMPRPKQSKRRRERIISSEERNQILDYLLRPRKLGEQLHAYEARRKVGLIFQFAMLTGMRHGEINKLKWSDVDWEARTLKVVGTKTETVTPSVRYLPITETMMAILEERQKKSATDYVFTRAGNTGSKFYRILREACDACDITYGKNTVGGLILHDARHTATTRMLQAGVDLSTIGSITGHSDKNLILYYGHATAASRARAAAVLEEYAGGDNFKNSGRQTGHKKSLASPSR
jgi:integrase